MPVNPEIRHWHDLARAAEAELDAATTHADLKLAARRLMRARRRLLALLPPHETANPGTPRTRRHRRPPSTGSDLLPLRSLV